MLKKYVIYCRCNAFRIDTYRSLQKNHLIQALSHFLVLIGDRLGYIEPHASADTILTNAVSLWGTEGTFSWTQIGHSDERCSRFHVDSIRSGRTCQAFFPLHVVVQHKNIDVLEQLIGSTAPLNDTLGDSEVCEDADWLNNITSLELPKELQSNMLELQEPSMEAGGVCDVDNWPNEPPFALPLNHAFDDMIDWHDKHAQELNKEMERVQRHIVGSWPVDAHTPRKQNGRAEKIWVCCMCVNAVIESMPTCPGCSHKRCSNCKDSPIAETSSFDHERRLDYFASRLESGGVSGSINTKRRRRGLG